MNSKKFNGKTFMKVSWKSKKSEAKEVAESYRNKIGIEKGRKARVVPEQNGYSIYVRSAD